MTVAPLGSLLEDVRILIEDTRRQTATAINTGLTLLYWRIGQRIRIEVLAGERAAYGEQIVVTLSQQLTSDYGRSFSDKNLRHMVRFAEVFPDEQIVYALSRQLTWTHFRALLYLEKPLQRDFYAEMCRIEGWSTRGLRERIDSMLYERTALSRKPDQLIQQELTDYTAVLSDIKNRIRSAQTRASLSVNRELIQLYWAIGGMIVQRQSAEGWGKSVVERLAADIQRDFPGVAGFLPQNIWYMRAFRLAWPPEGQDLQQPVGDSTPPPRVITEIPWGHNIQLISKVREADRRLWYAQQTVANGWSRSMLVHWIESDLYESRGKAIPNFKTTLPLPQSDLATEIIRDPYNSDLLTLRADAAEREAGPADSHPKVSCGVGYGIRIYRPAGASHGGWTGLLHRLALLPSQVALLRRD